VKKDRERPRAGSAPKPAPATVSQAIWVYLGLAALNLAIYARTLGFDFVTWDDPQYITENPYLPQGLTWSSAWWALTTGYRFYWHPLTWLSYLLDYEMFEYWAGGYHAVNVLLHIASTFVLFAALKQMTGAMWRSAFVAALFAVHPLHVESVAWISERKDALSALFWMLAMWGYARYARQPSKGRYAAVLALFAAGLMAKPSVVTLPFALLLLDFWPLGRMPNRAALHRLIVEKIPLFALSGVISIVTYLTQRSEGAVATFDALPLAMRIENGLVSYVAYLVKTVWPGDLAALYPFLPLPAWKIAGAVLVLAAISAAVYRFAARRPYLATGWLWYVGTLVPVIGLVQVGGMSMADRFTYLPHFGLFVIAAWGVAEAAARWGVSKTALAAAGGIAVLGYAVAASRQVEAWRDSVILWERTLAVTEANYRAHNNLGVELRNRRRTAEAAEHFREAVRIRANFAEGHNNLGGALAEQGHLAEAIEHYSQALRLRPGYSDAHNNLGVAFANQGKTDEAIREFQESLRIDPNQADAHSNLAVMYETSGRVEEAIQHFNAALRANPRHAEARRSLDRLAQQNRR
jgi:Tfp pilus assembly protein PilF